MPACYSRCAARVKVQGGQHHSYSLGPASPQGEERLDDEQMTVNSPWPSMHLLLAACSSPSALQGVLEGLLQAGALSLQRLALGSLLGLSRAGATG